HRQIRDDLLHPVGDGCALLHRITDVFPKNLNPGLLEKQGFFHDFPDFVNKFGRTRVQQIASHSRSYLENGVGGEGCARSPDEGKPGNLPMLPAVMPRVTPPGPRIFRACPLPFLPPLPLRASVSKSAARRSAATSPASRRRSNPPR